MKRKELVKLMIQMVVVYGFLKMIDYVYFVVPSLYNYFANSEPNDAWSDILPAIYFASWVGVCVLVFSQAGRIAGWVVRGEDGDKALPIASLSFKDCQVLGYQFIGILVMINAFPVLFEILSQFIRERFAYDAMGPVQLGRYGWEHLVVCLFRIGIGLFLFLRARGLAAVWQKLQNK